MLPDFRNVQSYDEIFSRFRDSARVLMLDYDLVFRNVPERRIHITSLELYLNCRIWPDPNTDKNPEQQNCGTWYVRRRGANANTSRIDLTAGSKADNVYCGLLVRGVDGHDGSGSALKTILRGERKTALLWRPEEIEALNQIHGSKIMDGPLELVPRKEPRTGTISSKPRVGLGFPEAPWDENLRIVLDHK
jgi:hypothetical protein